MSGGRSIATVLVLLLWAPVGCTSDICAGVRARLASDEPRVRVGAVHELGGGACPDGQILLIQSLADEDEGVRFYAAAALYRLAGERFGYLPQADPRDRAQAIVRWIDWYVSSHPEAAGRFDGLRAAIGAPTSQANRDSGSGEGQGGP